MKINNYVWENDLSLNDLVLKQKEKIDELQNQLQQKENIIKEVREYIEQCQLGEDNEGRPYMLANQEEGQELLEILDKENK